MRTLSINELSLVSGGDSAASASVVGVAGAVGGTVGSATGSVFGPPGAIAGVVAGRYAGKYLGGAIGAGLGGFYSTEAISGTNYADGTGY